MTPDDRLLADLATIAAGLASGYVCGRWWPQISGAAWRAWRWLLRV